MCRQCSVVWTSSWANATDERNVERTNDDRNPNDERGSNETAFLRDFVICASSFLRHSSFVIRHFCGRAVRARASNRALRLLFRQTHHQGKRRSGDRWHVEETGGIDPGPPHFSSH